MPQRYINNFTGRWAIIEIFGPMTVRVMGTTGSTTYDGRYYIVIAVIIP
jgi:hypothetical protein